MVTECAIASESPAKAGAQASAPRASMARTGYGLNGPSIPEPPESEVVIELVRSPPRLRDRKHKHLPTRHDRGPAGIGSLRHAARPGRRETRSCPVVGPNRARARNAHRPSRDLPECPWPERSSD